MFQEGKNLTSQKHQTGGQITHAEKVILLNIGLQRESPLCYDTYFKAGHLSTHIISIDVPKYSVYLDNQKQV